MDASGYLKVKAGTASTAIHGVYAAVLDGRIPPWKAERIAENIDLFGFELTAAEMDALATLDTGRVPARDPYEHGH